ncbi:MAG: hypothetical protein HQM12_10245 [SAR324 cluster bacterium]|nr:hypothetical protein [SAR324 cluster bacterium]
MTSKFFGGVKQPLRDGLFFVQEGLIINGIKQFYLLTDHLLLFEKYRQYDVVV